MFVFGIIIIRLDLSAHLTQKSDQMRREMNLKLPTNEKQMLNVNDTFISGKLKEEFI